MSAEQSNTEPSNAVYRNATIGETVTVHPVGDGVLRVEIDVDTVHHAPAPHVHPQATETFTVLDGELRVRLGLRSRVLHPGESVTVPPGAVHGYAGVPGRTARVLVELDPPGRMAEFFDAVYGLPASGRSASTGQPTLAAVAGLLLVHGDDVGVPLLPPALAHPLLRRLAARS